MQRSRTTVAAKKKGEGTHGGEKADKKNTFGISSRDIEAKLKEKGTDVHYFPSFTEIENFLLKNCINGDLLITMGAGDIVNVGEHLLGR